MSSGVQRQREVLASALENAIRLHEQGRFGEIWAASDEAWAEILAISDEYGPEISTGFTFWDAWGDSANHNWHHYEPIGEDDWPRLARVVMAAVNAGQVTDQPLVVDHILTRPPSLFVRLKRYLFGST